MLLNSRIQHRTRRCLIVMPDFQLSNAALELPRLLIDLLETAGPGGTSRDDAVLGRFGGGVRSPAEVPEVECTSTACCCAQTLRTLQPQCSRPRAAWLR